MAERTIYILKGGKFVSPRAHTDGDGYPAYKKDTSAVLDYTIDWSRALDGDTISTSSFASDGATIDSDTNTTAAATVWLSGGTSATEIVNTIVTGAGRTMQQTFRVYERDT